MNNFVFCYNAPIVLIDLTQVEKFLVDQRGVIASSRRDFWWNMEVQNPEELMKVLHKCTW